MAEKKQKAVTSKTIKNMMVQLKDESTKDIERVYNEWLDIAQKLAPEIDKLSSSSLKRIIKSVVVPEYDSSGNTAREAEAVKLLTDIIDLRIEMFISCSFLDTPKEEPKKE